MITKQAELLKKMEVVANWLDDGGFVKEASAIDDMMVKLAIGGWVANVTSSWWNDIVSIYKKLEPIYKDPVKLNQTINQLRSDTRSFNKDIIGMIKEIGKGIKSVENEPVVGNIVNIVKGKMPLIEEVADHL